MTDVKTLVRLYHGSHLYGLANSNSDIDIYEVYDFPWRRNRPRKQSSQKITDDIDEVRVSLERFTSFCYKGIPQAIETLFSSPEKWIEFDESWWNAKRSIENNFDVFITQILSTYKRTAWNFFKEDSFKKNLHALRLIHNAQDIKRYGKFNPTLNEELRERLTRTAELPRQQREEIFKNFFFDTFYDID